MAEISTNQDTSEKKFVGPAKPGEKRNPTGKGGFQDNPELRSDGRWSKENSISYQYHRFMAMPANELQAWGKNPPPDHTMAERLAFNRVMAAQKSLPDMKEITDRTEGKAKETVIWDGNLNASLDVKGVDDGTLTGRIRELVQATTRAKAGSDSNSRGNESPASPQANG